MFSHWLALVGMKGYTNQPWAHPSVDYVPASIFIHSFTQTWPLWNHANPPLSALTRRKEWCMGNWGNNLGWQDEKILHDWLNIKRNPFQVFLRSFTIHNHISWYTFHGHVRNLLLASKWSWSLSMPRIYDHGGQEISGSKSNFLPSC